jgi:hypothetical protein
MIPQVTKVNEKLDATTVQRIFDNVHQQAVGMDYASTIAIAEKKADVGRVAVWSDGNVSRIYFRDRLGNVCWVEGTATLGNIDGGGAP